MRPSLLIAAATLSLAAPFAGSLAAQQAAVTPATDSASFARRADALVDSLVAGDWFSGAILVTRNGRTLYARAAGLADRERREPNTLDTKFDVASMNKMMTGVVVTQLAREGRLSMGDRVGKHLPDYPNATVRDSVTIHRLLTHTGGLGSYWNARYQERRASVGTIAEYLALFADDALPLRPGERWEYSNSGYIVLGAIIEKVTGRPYDEVVRERVFQPAGMTGSGFWGLEEKVPQRSTPYAFAANPGRVSPARLASPAPERRVSWDTRPRRGSAAGGGYSTVRDLARFAAALRDGRLLPAAWRDSAWTGHAQRPAQMGAGGYGYGFFVDRGPLGRVVGHTGGQPGSGGGLDLHLDRGIDVAILTNVDPIGAMVINRRLRELLAEMEGVAPSRPSAMR